MGKNVGVDILCSADMVTSQAWMMQPKVAERSYDMAKIVLLHGTWPFSTSRREAIALGVVDYILTLKGPATQQPTDFGPFSYRP